MYKGDPKRTRRQSIAHTASILILVITFLALFSGLIIALIQQLATASNDDTQSLEFVADLSFADPEILIYALMLISSLVTGSLGIRAAYYPKKSKAFFIASIVSICIAIPSAAFGFSISVPYFVVNITFLAAPIFSVWASYKLRQEAIEYEETGREFIDPLTSRRYLGFLRFVEFAFVVNVLLTLIGLIFTSRNAVQYTPAHLIDWANIVFECIALWFIMRRFRVTRPFVIAFALFNITTGWTSDLILGDFDLLPNIFASLSDIVLTSYFFTSKRVKYICTQPFMLKESTSEEDDAEMDFKIERHGWSFIRRLAIFYCVFSLLGHWMEADMCQLIILGIVSGEYDPSNTVLWRDWFYPYPMEGLAVVFIALFLYPLKEKLVEHIRIPVIPYVLSFIANMLVCVAIEFAMGLIVNGDHQLWDYSNMVGNIMGQVCLQNALGFGAAASIITWLVYPLLERLLARIPNQVMNLIFLATVTAYAIPQTLYLIDPPVDIAYAAEPTSSPSISTGPTSSLL
jgi:uncharacterized membrane protein